MLSTLYTPMFYGGFFYDVKYRRFLGFIILSEDLEDLGGFFEKCVRALVFSTTDYTYIDPV